MTARSASRCPVRRRCRPKRSRAAPAATSSSCTSVRTSRVPDAPSGCPSATAPPFTFSRARSSSSAFSHATTWGANASLISKRSMSVRGEPRLLEEPRDRGHRAERHHVGPDADDVPRDDPGARLHPERVGPRARRDDERGGAVHDPGRVPGGHDAVLAERRLERRERLERRLGLDVVVALDLDLLAPLLHLDRARSRGRTGRRPTPSRRAGGCGARTRRPPCVERQFEVEDLARVDRAVPDEVDDLGRKRRTGAGPPCRWARLQNRSMPSMATPCATPTKPTCPPGRAARMAWFIDS